MATNLTLVVDRVTHELELAVQPDGTMQITQDGTTTSVRLERLGDSELFRLFVDDRVSDVVVRRAGPGLHVLLGATTHQVTIRRVVGVSMEPELALDQGELAMTAPMTGSVVEVLVQVGARVVKGDPLLVVVAMKMNNELKAPADGVVKAVNVSANDAVMQGDVLIVLVTGDGDAAQRD